MALKHQVHIVDPFTMPVGATEIAANSVCKIASSLLVVATASTEASAIFVIDEIGVADDFVRCVGVGSICLMNAHDSSIAEGEWVVPAAAGRVDTIAATTTAIQYVLGLALQDADAQDHKIAVWFIPHIVVGTQTV